MESLRGYGTLNVRFWFADVISQFTEERPLTVRWIKDFNIRQKMLAKQAEGRVYCLLSTRVSRSVFSGSGMSVGFFSNSFKNSNTIPCTEMS